MQAYEQRCAGRAATELCHGLLQHREGSAATAWRTDDDHRRAEPALVLQAQIDDLRSAASWACDEAQGSPVDTGSGGGRRLAPLTSPEAGRLAAKVLRIASASALATYMAAARLKAGGGVAATGKRVHCDAPHRVPN